MQHRPMSCEGCPLHTTSTLGFCPDKIPSNAEYLLLAEAPGKNEIAQAEPMVGQAGFVLKQWLMPAAIPLKIAYEKGKVGFANVLRCLPKEVQGRAYPKGKDKQEAERLCRQYDSWPSTIHTVILFGEHSQRLHFSPELDAEDATDKRLGHDLKGVMGRIGRVYERDGKRWVFAPHPAFVLRQPALVRHGQEALKIAVGMEKVMEPTYAPWETSIETT